MAPATALAQHHLLFQGTDTLLDRPQRVADKVGSGERHGLVAKAAEHAQEAPVPRQFGLAPQARPQVLGHLSARAAAAVDHEGKFLGNGVAADERP